VPLKSTEKSEKMKVTKSDSDVNFGNFRYMRNDDVGRAVMGLRMCRYQESNPVSSIQHRGVSRAPKTAKIPGKLPYLAADSDIFYHFSDFGGEEVAPTTSVN
jgi:hypothetical protein